MREFQEPLNNLQNNPSQMSEAADEQQARVSPQMHAEGQVAPDVSVSEAAQEGLTDQNQNPIQVIWGNIHRRVQSMIDAQQNILLAQDDLAQMEAKLRRIEEEIELATRKKTGRRLNKLR